jgi:hypothetical protein
MHVWDQIVSITRAQTHTDRHWNTQRAPSHGTMYLPSTLKSLGTSHPSETRRNTRDVIGQRFGQNAHLPRTRKRPAS